MPVVLLIVGVVTGGVVGALVARSRGRAKAPAEPVHLHVESSAELARLRVALDALPVGVVLASATGSIVYRNSASEHLAGSRPAGVLVDEAVDRLIADALSGRDEVRTLEEAVPASEIAGTRYAEPLMKHLDSER